MTKILFIAGIIFYIIHRYFLKQQNIKESIELHKQAEVRKASIEIQRQKEAIELQKRASIEIQRQKEAIELRKREAIKIQKKEAEDLQRLKEAIELQEREEAEKLQKQAIKFAEGILERIKKQGGLNYSYDSPYYQYFKKIDDFKYGLNSNDLERNLISAGRQDLIKQIKYGFKYLYLCPDCKTVTDVKKTEINHGHDETEYLSNGRYTKDGSLDERYNSEFRKIHNYYFDAVCENCKCTFKVELDQDDYKSRNEL